MSENTRQHYRYALGEALGKTPTGKSPGYAKGGAVKFKKMGSYKKGAGTAYRKPSGRGC